MGRGPQLLASKLGWDSLHHGSTPFKVQEGASALGFCAGGVEKREESFQSYTSKELEAVGGNVTSPASPSLDQPALAWLLGKANCYSSCPALSGCFSQFLWLFSAKTELTCFPLVCFGLHEGRGEGSRRVSEHTRKQRLIDQITMINQLL